MSAIAALRNVTRVGPARLAAGMRVSMVSTMVRPMSKMTVAKVAGARAFSATSGRLGSGSSDLALSQKLQEELKYEQEALAEQADVTPEFLKSFLEQGVWSIDDVRGNDEVTMFRKFGDENLRLMFSIADIAPEENFDMEGESEEDQTPIPAIRVSLSITKNNGPGAMNVDLICEDTHMTVENISFYDDAKLGTELTAEADWNRRGLYIGPQFETLDVGVQDEFEKYLQERGINESLATFIPEYAAHKEQQEYVKWLGKVKNFIDL
ncbi:Mitochondrial acidic protein mam33 [Psilocybe cubensis]|uniref:Mitochondrial glyco protein n=2 Tax=Psilocybe cubensis TaxID=181762 RepID=A0A8H8CKB5_PSICU|nr:Mitochondrial acidic protein mam33 [Psilocybe cubensis]KAH9478223.1 Mitochondrial acidic protein mam33 [Psilocybe cubensis]